MFSASDPTAEAYAATAVRFTRRLPELSLEGGLYIWQITPAGHLEKLKIRAGDILIELQGKTVRRVDELQERLLKTPEKTPIPFKVLRWEEDRDGFIELEYSAPGKPLGGGFMPI